MPDIAGNNTTTSSINVGSSVSSSIETPNDHDWFRIDLVAGQTVTITLSGSGATPLSDPYLRLRNASGTLLGENDDSGGSLNSTLNFTATTTGTYYIDAAAWASSTGETSTGSYTLEVRPYTPPPLATVDQFANQLTNGYWGGSSHHFNVAPGGNLTVNLTALTADGINLARLALRQWSDVIGVTFVEVTSGGQITFDDNQDGAFSSANYSGGLTSSAIVNVSTQWLADYGNTINTYGYQTYIHEIGHALGLGHAGNYNSTAVYSSDAVFLNDAWPMSVMSYFSVDENPYFSNQGFTRTYLGTPMLADIAAMSVLYGLSTTTRLGATTYGFNSNAGNVFNATLYPSISYTVFDSGGIDTLDYSGFAQSQLIDLREAAFSNVGGEFGNVSIAVGTIIENATGGSGADQIIGNEVSNLLVGGGGNDVINSAGGDDILTGGSGSDRLTGGAGGDTFRGTLADMSGDTIVDFSGTDRILFSDASLASFSFSLAGSTLTFSGGSLTLGTVVAGSLTASSAVGGGVQLSLVTSTTVSASTLNDFNGDGRADILWRDGNGAITTWLGKANGGFLNNDANALRFVPQNWQIAQTGDFNGDGRSDILWRETNGAITTWLGQANGGFVINDSNALQWVPQNWHIAQTGDFNGDGRSDILWREANGAITTWLGKANGGFLNNDSSALQWVPQNWQIEQTGDFNGDGRSDILWREANGAITTWLGKVNGGFLNNDANALQWVPENWQIQQTGDFNGDGRSDILWREANGAITTWLGQANGGFVINDSHALEWVPQNWQIEQTGDFNGDGRSDILWRETNGAITTWLGEADGGFLNNDSNALQWVPLGSHVQPVHADLF